jgi:Flp pilus assembly protein TadD
VQARPDAIAYASLGLAQMCLGDERAARTAFERSLQLDPNQPMLLRALGR